MKNFKLNTAKTFFALIFMSSLQILAMQELPMQETVKLDSNDVFNACRVVQVTKSNYNGEYANPYYDEFIVIELQGVNKFGTLTIDEAKNDYFGLKKLTLILQDLQSKGKCPQ